MKMIHVKRNSVLVFRKYKQRRVKNRIEGGKDAKRALCKLY